MDKEPVDRKHPELLRETDLIELVHLSLGYKAQESAEIQSIPYNTVRTRRKIVKRRLGAKTMHQAVVIGIQNRSIPIENDVEEYKDLSLTQTFILHLIANGWTMDEIANRYQIRKTTVSHHYERIRDKLNARTIIHAMRRAFEVGIFDIDSQIKDPDEIIDDITGGLEVGLGKKKPRKLNELGITHPHQIELISILGKLGVSQFNSSDIQSEGFFSGAQSYNALAHAYGRAVLGIATKLEAAHGKPVMLKHGDRGQRQWIFTENVSIGRKGNMIEIPAFKGAIQEMPNPLTVQVDSPSNEHIVHEHASKFADEPRTVIGTKPAEKPMIEIPFDEVWDRLRFRNPAEVKDDEEMIATLDSLAKDSVQFDYRHKIIMALRYGVDPRSFRPAIAVRLRGEIIPTDKITESVPLYRGLDVSSVSMLLCQPESEIISSELDFIEKHLPKNGNVKKLKNSLQTELSSIEDRET